MTDQDDPRPIWDQPHLPLPWSAVEDEDDGKWKVLCDGYEDETPIVCVGTRSWPLSEADARIIASALDLLAAAQAVVKARKDYETWVTDGPAGRAVLALMGVDDETSLRAQSREAFAALDAAIAKATGQ